MPLTVVTGGQFGSEGKGKVAYHLVQKEAASFAVRCGGSNSGHTIIDGGGNVRIFQHLPTAAILNGVRLGIGSGSYLDVGVLLSEIRQARIEKGRLLIDPMAAIISRRMKEAERASGLIESIGSTGCGVGQAVMARAARDGSLLFAKDIPVLKPFITDVSEALRNALSKGERVVLEGTQGFGLSPLHSGYYPKSTSRDTTAAAFVSEVGLSPLDVDEIALVIRAFPIRVGGDSGEIPNEIDWDTVTREGRHSIPIVELTTVTHRVRRVGRFDPHIVRKAIAVNKPTSIFLNHVDYLKEGIGMKEARRCVDKMGEKIGQEITAFGLSPSSVIY